MKLATGGKICKPFRGTSSPTIVDLNPTETSLVTDGQNSKIHRQDNRISQCDCSVAERKCGHDVPRAATGATARAGQRQQHARAAETRRRHAADSSPGSTRSTAADLLRNTMVSCIFPPDPFISCKNRIWNKIVRMVSRMVLVRRATHPGSEIEVSTSTLVH